MVRMKENLRISTVMRVINVVLGVVNIVLFALWLSMIRKDALPVGGDAATYLLNQLSVGVAILSVILTVAALVLTGLGFIGFQAVAERAERTAEKAAREEASSFLRTLVEQNNVTVFNSGNKGPLPNVEGATKEKE